jgi:hypothetical protein
MIAQNYKQIRKVITIKRSTKRGMVEFYQMYIPKLWAEKVGLDKYPYVEVCFNGVLKIMPVKRIDVKEWIETDY